MKIIALALAAAALQAQAWDPGATLNKRLAEETGKRFKLRFEFRNRLEARTGNNFGRDVNLQNPLTRLRIGAEWKPVTWLKLSATGQDARAPFYGRVAPTSARDTMDVQESYLEFLPDAKRGFGAMLGRQMASFGEARLIGVPQWVNTARTYDAVRIYYRLPRARLEFLMLSLAKVRPDDYNRPGLGDRLWGMYNTFNNFIPKGLVETYVLRRDQNRPGGFTGVGTIGINTFGGRAVGPLPAGFKYNLEGAVQTGHVGPLAHRGLAWYSAVSRTISAKYPLDLSLEYKYASGSKEPGLRSGTFDQLYAANHDKFGHADLFGWRNIHGFRSVDTLRIGKNLSLNFMYDNLWLVSARDSIYSLQGRPILRSVNGTAGRHVGHEADLFAVRRWGAMQFGAGFAHLFKGEFLKNTTPGVNTRYMYIFQSYSF